MHFQITLTGGINSNVELQGTQIHALQQVHTSRNIHRDDDFQQISMPQSSEIKTDIKHLIRISKSNIIHGNTKSIQSG